MAEPIKGFPKFADAEVIWTNSLELNKPASDTGEITGHEVGLVFNPILLAFATYDDQNYYPLPYYEFTSGGLLSLEIRAIYFDNWVFLEANSPDVTGTSAYDSEYNITMKYYLLRLRGSS